jgi:hypothetical protein
MTDPATTDPATTDTRTVEFLVGRAVVRAPNWVVKRGWGLQTKGYVQWKSRGRTYRRGQYLHRVVMERLLGRDLLTEEHVHHQDFNKLNNCPCNLVIVSPELNPRPEIRDPYTGKFLGRDEYVRRYGQSKRVLSADSEVPDWVNEIGGDDSDGNARKRWYRL